jgi:hypothetical protein
MATTDDLSGGDHLGVTPRQIILLGVYGLSEEQCRYFTRRQASRRLRELKAREAADFARRLAAEQAKHRAGYDTLAEYERRCFDEKFGSS